MLDRITPVILTRDEEPNIARTLGQLQWAKDVVVIDSGSTDRTVEIARSFPNVRVIQRPFDTHAAQWQFGVSQAQTEWVLALDADYYVPASLTAELAALNPDDSINGYTGHFMYAVNGKPLRASLYPPHVVLFRRDRVSITQDGHAQRYTVPGVLPDLREKLIHDDRKSFARFLKRQRRYMAQEAEKLRVTPSAQLNYASRIRKLRVVAPLVILPYTLFVKRTVFDGWPGIRYALERLIAECVLSAALFRRRDRTSRQ